LPQPVGSAEPETKLSTIAIPKTTDGKAIVTYLNQVIQCSVDEANAEPPSSRTYVIPAEEVDDHVFWIRLWIQNSYHEFVEFGANGLSPCGLGMCALAWLTVPDAKVYIFQRIEFVHKKLCFFADQDRT
jgi:hypothetical protein